MSYAETSQILLMSLAACLLIAARGSSLGPEKPQDAKGAADAWQFACPREEIAPKHWKHEKVRHERQPTLALAGDGRVFVNGRWQRTVPVRPGAWVRFETHFLAEGVEQLHRSVLARVLWMDAQGKQIGQPAYPRTLPDRDEHGWGTIAQTYRTPDQAAQARLELIYRWDADGVVHFSPARLEEVQPPQPRRVRLATIFRKPQDGKIGRDNLQQFAELIARAAERQADIICLPEGATLYGTKRTYVQVAEPIPGPSCAFLGKLAKKHRLYIVAGIFEREGPAVYNTSILLGRDGKLVGKYRKVCLPREEIDGGVTPGDAFPVFDTDFGRIGMMICWDNQFPAPARALAQAGAEVIFMPIWGGNLTLTRARAIENQVYIVSCTYGMKSAVFDLEGEILAEATAEEPVVVTEVDLSAQKLWPWLGDLKGRIPREMPPRSTGTIE